MLSSTPYQRRAETQEEGAKEGERERVTGVHHIAVATSAEPKRGQPGITGVTCTALPGAQRACPRRHAGAAAHAVITSGCGGGVGGVDGALE